MRDALKNLFRSEIILEDNSHYYYTVNPYELTNALGAVVAVLQEYNFSKKDNEAVTCKLYRTKEGNWYDIEEAKIFTEKNILRMLKSAIDLKENKVFEAR